VYAFENVLMPVMKSLLIPGVSNQQILRLKSPRKSRVSSHHILRPLKFRSMSATVYHCHLHVIQV